MPGRALSAPLRFGIWDWLDHNKRVDVADLYEQRLQMLEYADRAGFYGYHLAEHHGIPLSMSPSPNLFFVAVAQRTRRLRFGSMVYLLPFYNPLRLVEEVCMLDHLSRGRLDLGIGRPDLPLRDGHVQRGPRRIQVADERDAGRAADGSPHTAR